MGLQNSMTKKKTISLIQSSNDYTEILFGQKPVYESLYDGYWHPTYRYKKLLENAPYYPVLRVTHPNNKITDVNIIFRPSKDGMVGKDLDTKNYNWANPYFWIEMGFYPKLKYKRIQDSILALYARNKPEDGLKWLPIDEDFGIIFDDIWQICVTKEGMASMSREAFSKYICLLKILIENTIVFPLEEINNYELWQKYVHNYLEETVCDFFDTTEESEKILKGWHVAENTSPKKMQDIFLADIKTILNQFCEKIKPDNGLTIFLNKIYRSYSDELVSWRLFIKCAHCGHLAEYLKNKKYCSYSADGKNCGKSARNRRYYSVKGKARLPKYRKATKELRAFYREKGIKK